MDLPAGDDLQLIRQLLDEQTSLSSRVRDQLQAPSILMREHPETRVVASLVQRKVPWAIMAVRRERRLQRERKEEFLRLSENRDSSTTIFEYDECDRAIRTLLQEVARQLGYKEGEKGRERARRLLERRSPVYPDRAETPFAVEEGYLLNRVGRLLETAIPATRLSIEETRVSVRHELLSDPEVMASKPRAMALAEFDPALEETDRLLALCELQLTRAAVSIHTLSRGEPADMSALDGQLREIISLLSGGGLLLERLRSGPGYAAAMVSEARTVGISLDRDLDRLIRRVDTVMEELELLGERIRLWPPYSARIVEHEQEQATPKLAGLGPGRAAEAGPTPPSLDASGLAL